MPVPKRNGPDVSGLPVGQPDGGGQIMTLLEGYSLLERLYRALEEGERELEQARGGRPICVSACGLCCQRIVPMAMVIEVKYILSHLHMLPGPEIKARALGWMAERHPGLILWEKVRGRPYRDEERRLLVDDQHTLERTACPFLTADKLCLLYRVRPLVCRAYGVTLPQDPWCPRPLHITETAERRMGVGPSGPLGKAIIKLKGALVGRLRQAGATNLLVSSWLPGLLARDLAREELISLQSEGKVADIKLALASVIPRLWTEEQDTPVIPVHEVLGLREVRR